MTFCSIHVQESVFRTATAWASSAVQSITPFLTTCVWFEQLRHTSPLHSLSAHSFFFFFFTLFLVQGIVGNMASKHLIVYLFLPLFPWTKTWSITGKECELTFKGLDSNLATLHQATCVHMSACLPATLHMIVSANACAFIPDTHRIHSNPPLRATEQFEVADCRPVI